MTFDSGRNLSFNSSAVDNTKLQLNHENLDRNLMADMRPGQQEAWYYNSRNQMLFFNNQKRSVTLRCKTAKILELLIRSANQIVETDEFFSEAWPDKYVTDNVLTQSIKELRTHFNDKERTIIKTVSKRGYKLCANITSVTADNTSHVSGLN